MARVTIRREGRLYRKLDKLPGRMRQAVAEAMVEQAEAITDFMRQAAPVEPGKPDLKDSIGYRWLPSNNEDLRLKIFAAGGQYFYGYFVEFGTVKMTAQPFFYPSWRAHKGEMVERMKGALVRAVESVAAGG